MTQQNVRPMPRLIFDMMSFTFRIRDLLKKPHDVLATVGLKPGMTVVDYGCGPGNYTMVAAKLVGATGKVYGVDIHPQAVKSVQRKARGMQHIEAKLANGYDSGVPAHCADYVLLMDMLHMVPDQDALLAEVHRILKPDGVLFVQVHHMSMTEAQDVLCRSECFEIGKQDGMDIWAWPAH